MGDAVSDETTLQKLRALARLATHERGDPNEKAAAAMKACELLAKLDDDESGRVDANMETSEHTKMLALRVAMVNAMNCIQACSNELGRTPIEERAVNVRTNLQALLRKLQEVAGWTGVIDVAPRGPTPNGYTSMWWDGSKWVVDGRVPDGAARARHVSPAVENHFRRQAKRGER
jgi:hypothetical protein